MEESKEAGGQAVAGPHPQSIIPVAQDYQASLPTQNLYRTP
jgi:hypothetical protein